MAQLQLMLTTALEGILLNLLLSPNVDDLAKAENFIDNTYVEANLDGNKSQYSNLVKDIETD